MLLHGSQIPQFDPGMTVATSVPPANSNAVSLLGKSVQVTAGIVVTICLNYTLRHSRIAGQVADDWISPAFPAPATTPVTGIIGPAEESFGLRKSPTAPMLRASPSGGWQTHSPRGVVVGLVSDKSDARRRRY